LSHVLYVELPSNKKGVIMIQDPNTQKRPKSALRFCARKSTEFLGRDWRRSRKKGFEQNGWQPWTIRIFKPTQQ
jgi:hypothetical protein